MAPPTPRGSLLQQLCCNIRTFAVKLLLINYYRSSPLATSHFVIGENIFKCLKQALELEGPTSYHIQYIKLYEKLQDKLTLHHKCNNLQL